MKHSYSNDDTCFSIDVIDEILEEDFDALLDEGRKILHSIEGTLLEEEIFSKFNKFIAMTADENSKSESDTKEPPFEKIIINTDYKIKTSLEEPPTDLELKPLHDNIEYVFLEEPSFLPVIISSRVSAQNKSKLIQLLDDKKPVVQKQRRLNPNMQEVVKKEIVKLLDTGIIYPIGDSPWRMPFGLCNALTTFQRCMLAIFHDMIEESIEVFMDDFSVFRNSFDKCLNNLDKMLQRCKDAHLVLNWEKCHFMVKEGIVLRHKVSSTGLEVDKAKINLLEKDIPFEFDDECQKAFDLLKEKLTCAPVIVSPNWDLPFELMCDASDFAVGAVLVIINRLRNHIFKRDDSHGEAFPTATSLDAGQDRENIPKTSAMPHESSPRVTSLGGDEGSLQLKLNELMDFCTKLQSQHSQMATKNQSQDLKISQLKTKIKTLEDAQTTRGDVQEDALNRGGMMDQGEDFGIERDSNKSTNKGSESTGEMANVLRSMGATNILASRGLKEVFTTASLPVPPVSLFVPTVAATASEKDSTAAVITTTTAVTPYTRRTKASRGVVMTSSSPIHINIPSISKEDNGKGIITEHAKPTK
ncbi:reverse transcriptase domain-containing protein [Tanacetum coccineum]